MPGPRTEAYAFKGRGADGRDRHTALRQTRTGIPHCHAPLRMRRNGPYAQRGVRSWATWMTAPSSPQATLRNNQSNCRLTSGRSNCITAMSGRYCDGNGGHSQPDPFVTLHEVEPIPPWPQGANRIQGCCPQIPKLWEPAEVRGIELQPRKSGPIRYRFPLPGPLCAS